MDVNWGGSSTYGEIWDLRSCKKVQTLPMKGYMNGAFVLSPNGRYLFDQLSLSAIWDIETGRRLAGAADRMILTNDTLHRGLELSKEESQRQQRQRMMEAEFLPDYFRAARMLPLSQIVYRADYGNHPYKIDVYGVASEDGSKLFVSEAGSTIYSIWDGNTLRRLGAITVSEDSYIFPSPDGSRIISVGESSRKVYDTETGRVVFELPQIPESPGSIDDKIEFLKHDDVIIENIGLPPPDRGVAKRRFWRWRTGELIRTVDGSYLPFADSTLGQDAWVKETEILSMEGLCILFDFKWVDSDVAGAVEFSPDRRFAMTAKGDSRQIWKKIRPEHRWGLLLTYEIYLFAALLLATAWSLFRRRVEITGSVLPADQPGVRRLST